MRRLGALTQGATPEQALRNLNEIVQLIVDELQKDGVDVPN